MSWAWFFLGTAVSGVAQVLGLPVFGFYLPVFVVVFEELEDFSRFTFYSQILVAPAELCHRVCFSPSSCPVGHCLSFSFNARFVTQIRQIWGVFGPF